MTSLQTRYSDPGRHAALLDEVPADIPTLSAVARNLIVHYRASECELPGHSRDDIHLRWLSAILQTDQERHGSPLSIPRDEPSRVQGCCRDHSLFATGVMRHHGVPARTRVGFSRYLTDDYHSDHVVVEAWLHDGDGTGRWRRFDPEIGEPLPGLPDPTDIASGPDSPFCTAAEAWQGYRAGRVDPNTFGLGPGSEFAGPWFIQNYVLIELAHREGDELLLWDVWGAMSWPGEDPNEPELTDEIAALLVAADGGDPGAEEELARRYHTDDRLSPGEQVLRVSPHGDMPPVKERIGPASASPA